eukprot:10473689-Lingulodinium_polyedra.AAC.1
MGPVWCPACGLWLSSPEQFLDHARGKKHRKATGAHLARPRVGPAEGLARDCARRYLLLLSLRIPRQLERGLVPSDAQLWHSAAVAIPLAATAASLP